MTRHGLRARLHALTGPGAPSASTPVASAPPADSETHAIRAALDDPILGPELRALLSVGSRREARDRHAMSVLLAGTLRRDAHTIYVGAHSGAVLREVLRPELIKIDVPHTRERFDAVFSEPIWNFVALA